MGKSKSSLPIVPGQRISHFLSLVPGLKDYLVTSWPKNVKTTQYIWNDLLTNPTDAFLAHAQKSWNLVVPEKSVKQEIHVGFDTNGSHAAQINEVLSGGKKTEGPKVLFHFQRMRK